MLTYEQVSPTSPRRSTNLRREFNYDVLNQHPVIFATDHGSELRLLATCGRARRLALHGVFRHPGVAHNALPSWYNLPLQRGARLDIPGIGLIPEHEVSRSMFTAPRNVFQYLLIRPVQDVVWQIQIPVSSRLHAPQKSLRTEIAGEKWHAIKHGIAGPFQGNHGVKLALKDIQVAYGCDPALFRNTKYRNRNIDSLDVTPQGILSRLTRAQHHPVPYSCP